MAGWADCGYASASQAAADALASPGAGRRRSASPSPVQGPISGASSPLWPASGSSPLPYSWAASPLSPFSPTLGISSGCRGSVGSRRRSVVAIRETGRPPTATPSFVGIAGSHSPVADGQVDAFDLAPSPGSPLTISALLFSPSPTRPPKPPAEAGSASNRHGTVGPEAKQAPGVSGQLFSPSPTKSGGRQCRNSDASGSVAAFARSLVAQPSPSSAAPPLGDSTSVVGAEPQMWSVADFELGPRIGAGTFGYVQLVRERQSGSKAVLKVMRKRRIQRMRVQRHVKHEIEIQAHLRHTGVLRLLGYFWDASKIYMILEHAHHGDLGQFLKAQPNGRFQDAEAARYIAQVTAAIAYCHSVHVIHRDVKPQNILVARKGKLKLADFGWAVHAAPGDYRWTLCGTLDYLPPEMVYVTRGHSFGVDVWGLGILTYELLVGDPPFVTPTHEETYKLILSASPMYPSLTTSDRTKPESEHPSQVSLLAQEFIGELIKRDPSDRILPQDALEHPWLQQVHVRACGAVKDDCSVGHGKNSHWRNDDGGPQDGTLLGCAYVAAASGGA